MVLFGGTGQVGRALAEMAGSFDLLAPPRDQADLSRPDGIAPVLAARPDIVVNAAAYTAVDRAEDEPRRRLPPTATARRRWRGSAPPPASR